MKLVAVGRVIAFPDDRSVRAFAGTSVLAPLRALKLRMVQGEVLLELRVAAKAEWALRTLENFHDSIVERRRRPFETHGPSERADQNDHVPPKEGPNPSPSS
jgi:hypothetical protein